MLLLLLLLLALETARKGTLTYTYLHSRYKVNGPNKFRVCDDMLYGWCTHTIMCVLEDTNWKAMQVQICREEAARSFVSPDERIRNQQASDARRFGIYPSNLYSWSPSQRFIILFALHPFISFTEMLALWNNVLDQWVMDWICIYHVRYPWNRACWN